MFATLLRGLNRETKIYLKRCRNAVKHGQPLPEPSSVEELREVRTRWPDDSIAFQPTAAVLESMGLPHGWPHKKEVTQ